MQLCDPKEFREPCVQIISVCAHVCACAWVYVCVCVTYIEKNHAGLLESRNFHLSAQNDRVPPEFVI